jgi:hypothetical protein
MDSRVSTTSTSKSGLGRSALGIGGGRGGDEMELFFCCLWGGEGDDG